MRVPLRTVPVLVCLFAALGVLGADLLAIPSYTRDYAPTPASPAPHTTTLRVRGLRCVDTAKRVADQLDGLDGVVRLTAYASRRQAQIVYDPARTNPDALRRAIEGPAYDAETDQYLFHLFEVLEIDGRTPR